MEDDKSPNGTFTQVPNMLLDSCDLPETSQILFFKLLRRVGHTGGVFVGSTRKLANLTNMSKSTVDRGLETLAKANLLTIGHQISNETEQEVMRITLNMDDIWSINRYHSKVAPVPNWDSTLPNLDNLPKTGTEQPELGREELDVSANSNEDREKTANTNKTMEDAAHILSPEALLIFNWCVGDGEYDPKLDAKVIVYCEKIAEHIKTREQYNSLREIARANIHGDDKTVYLGNMASKKNINAWLKSQEQPTPEHQEDDIYYHGMEIPANVERAIERACIQKWGESFKHSVINKAFQEIEMPPKRFETLFNETLKDATDPDDVPVRMKRWVTVGTR